MLDKKRSLKRSLLGGIASFLLLGISAFLLLNQQYVKDQISYRSFEPSASVKALEKNISFTEKGAFYFYAQQPEIEGSEAFNKSCQRQEVGNPILGCYVTNKIFVFDVTNEKLEGIEEVTAAHETLHAVWDRLSKSEQESVGALLEAEYAKQTDNAELKERMEYYKRTEPGQLQNELHSILGTEIKTLSPDLEAHYAKYFSNRQIVVGYHTKYATVFSDLKRRADSLYAELTSLSVSIQTRSDQYDINVAQLSRDIGAFNTRANNAEFTSNNQFNRERAVLLTRTNQLDADRASISTDIDQYNAKYDEYQSISSEIEVLNKSIDSIKDLQPAPSV